MSIEFLWKLSTTSGRDRRRGEWEAGDRLWAKPEEARSRDRQINRYDYLAQVARAADLTGFDGLVIPDEPEGEEPWIVTGALLGDAPNLKLITTVAPGSATALYAAKMAATAQTFSHGRQAWEIDLTADRQARQRSGDFIADEDVEARVREFIDIARGVWGDGPYSRDGRFFMVENSGLGDLVTRLSPPQLYFRGANETALALSASLGDVHLFDHAPLDVLRRQARHLRTLAGDRASHIRIGVAIPVIARETEQDVAAERAWRALPPNALTDTYEDVAGRLIEYADAGFGLFELTADRQLEEAYVAGEQIVGRVRRHFTPFVRTAA